VDEDDAILIVNSITESGARTTYSTLAFSSGSKSISPSPSLMGSAGCVDLESVMLVDGDRKSK
jgi:hypothetical protein